MKHILLVYLFISLIFVALFSLLSYGYGSGYVYLLWRNWQVQTNLWILIAFIILMSFILQVGWMLIKRSIAMKKRKIENVTEFQNLHPYEQLGILWLIEGAQDQKGFIQQVFSNSGMLNEIISAKLLFDQGKYSEALTLLNQAPPSAFELAELLRIQIFLAEADQEQALTHLEFLSQHELSPWLSDIKDAYKEYLAQQWRAFAIQFPWGYLHSTQAGYLDVQSNEQWLQQLLVQFNNASEEDKQLLQQRYALLAESVPNYSHNERTLWLKLLARLPEMSLQHEDLSLQLLDEQFDQDVFYLWFQQQLLKQNPDYDLVEKEIDILESKYQHIPILSFAKWHVLNATGRESEANQLLTLYPDNNLMNYLRIKSTLNGNPELIQQLNSIFENDANYLKFKI
ncbi:heme biosynthesis protein HemY [Acinetobacter gerneri]|jgi:hypothetical protein|uniref:heme biosynthesis protein HemY n=1 Tax=Acinetobacter gerneri TaxID=202952 RepID=UPI0023F3F2E9|nr:heme biosynthesis protein HemY [Acinetobacter gerneri]MCH4244795.1 tetratricopeptide repeat protein [Acinetobacter gerneri]